MALPSRHVRFIRVLNWKKQRGFAQTGVIDATRRHSLQFLSFLISAIVSLFFTIFSVSLSLCLIPPSICLSRISLLLRSLTSFIRNAVLYLSFLPLSLFLSYSLKALPSFWFNGYNYWCLLIIIDFELLMELLHTKAGFRVWYCNAETRTNEWWCNQYSIQIYQIAQ